MDKHKRESEKTVRTLKRRFLQNRNANIYIKARSNVKI